MNDNLTWPSTVKWDNSISTTIDSNCITTSSNAGSYYYDESSPNINDWGYKYYPPPYNTGEQFDEAIKRLENKINNNKKGDENMRYLYEVILVNPKSDTFYVDRVVARSETSALMEIYKDSPFNEKCESGIVCDATPFDDLKYNCKQLMEWKKEKSLEKALETIKKAVE